MCSRAHETQEQGAFPTDEAFKLKLSVQENIQGGVPVKYKLKPS